LGLNFLLSEFFNFNIFASPVWKAICALLIIFIGIKILENDQNELNKSFCWIDADLIGLLWFFESFGLA